MTAPYPAGSPACPSCAQPLRSFRERLACDACDGIMLAVADLRSAVFEMTSLEPVLELERLAPGKRSCPRCGEPMATCHLVMTLEHEVERPRVELDHCEHHGLWFDQDELAEVLATIAGKGYGGGVGRKATPHSGPPEQGRWSAMFKKFGGHGGW